MRNSVPPADAEPSNDELVEVGVAPDEDARESKAEEP